MCTITNTFHNELIKQKILPSDVIFMILELFYSKQVTRYQVFSVQLSWT